VLFLPDLSRLERTEQRHIEFLLPRADKYKARVVCFRRSMCARWSRSTSSIPICACGSRS